MNLSYQRRRRISDLVLREFFRLAEFWELNTKEKMRLLGVKSYQEFKKRKSGKVVLSNNELERLGRVFNIYKNLYILFPNSEARKNWMKKKNQAPMFQGKSAMRYIMEGNLPAERILAVRNYLASQVV